MAVSVCPADQVQAPVEIVWELLMRPDGYGRFWDLTVEQVEPGGPAVVGRKFFGWTRRALGWRWRLDRRFHDGVADSLQRLKRAAEERAR
jgi:hypothetical protein